MKKIEGNKLVALLLSAGMVTALLAACTINTDELGEGISDLGNAFTVQTEKPTETEMTVTEATETSAETTPEETEAPTPTATPTATPSPTPMPQRVDFSDYTEVDLTDGFTVTLEDFSESVHSQKGDELLGTFEGNRLVVTEASNETVMGAINLIVDGFYKEAEGAFSRVAAKAESVYNLTGVVESTYAVNVSFEYTTNGRVLSVLMRYDVTGVEEDKSTVIDFASFDMLSGQYVTSASVTKDPTGLENALKAALEADIKAKAAVTTTVPVTTVTTEETTETTEETAPKVPGAADFEKFYIGAGTTVGDPNQGIISYVTLFGIVDGEVYSAKVDVSTYAGYLNRYGASVLIV